MSGRRLMIEGEVGGGPAGVDALNGVRVAVTRVAGQVAELYAGLEALGAEVVVAPLIRIGPSADPVALEGAARRVGWYDWVVFTSSNGVEYFGAALAAVGIEPASVAGVRVACIGPATAAAAEGAGWRPQLVSRRAVAESLLEALLDELEVQGGGAGVRVLLPVAAGARGVLEHGLSAVGAEVDRVEAYRTVCDRIGADRLLPQLAAGAIDLVLLASPSAVHCLAAAAGIGDSAGAAGCAAGAGAGAASGLEGSGVEGGGVEGGHAEGVRGWAEVLGGARVGVIGPVTGAAARRCGLEVDIEAEEHTAAGLLRAIREWYRV